MSMLTTTRLGEEFLAAAMPGKAFLPAARLGEAFQDTVVPGEAIPGAVVLGEACQDTVVLGEATPGAVTPGMATPAAVGLGEPCQAAVPGEATLGSMVAGAGMVVVEPGKSSRETVVDAVNLRAVGDADVLALPAEGVVVS